jgi:hypothetical protein
LPVRVCQALFLKPDKQPAILNLDIIHTGIYSQGSAALGINAQSIQFVVE